MATQKAAAVAPQLLQQVDSPLHPHPLHHHAIGPLLLQAITARLDVIDEIVTRNNTHSFSDAVGGKQTRENSLLELLLDKFLLGAAVMAKTSPRASPNARDF